MASKPATAKLVVAAVVLAAVAAISLVVTLERPREEPALLPSPTPVVQPQPSPTPQLNETNATPVQQEPEPQPQPEPQPELGPCNYDRYCDAGETEDNCYSDCGPVFYDEDADVYSNRTFYGTTTPTLAFDVSSGSGVASCGTAATSSLKWDCMLSEPGATTTKVSCTLLNYGYDGRYSLSLHCKDNDGSDLPKILIDNIIVCANATAGCM